MSSHAEASFPEYSSLGLFNPEMTLDEKRTFVGEKGSSQANCDMSPVRLALNRAFVADKVMYSSLLAPLGIPTTATQAVASGNRKFGSIPALKSPPELLQFLTQKATFPLLGKPCEGSGSSGSVDLERIEDDLIVLGNGRKVLLESFCNEVYADYPDGFMLQSALRQHPEFCKIAGKAVGSLRFVTIRDQDKPRKLYAPWKVPSPNAKSDNFWQQGSILVQIDDNGVLGEARTGIGLDAQSIERNANPFRSLYQLAYGRGLFNPDFVPAVENASKISADMLNQIKELEKFRRDARRS
ncbi:sugar-transfer associated ATP-grasp domain-containing protein [Ruegeria sp. MALMAid1280]|uniref:sugar-transfer associated ATP-grasp domain-containing protein n=1 Tax=Ruegeria sp. MALMAid1280 TaxID=3411634 RepID=UPI003B9F287C